MDNERLLQAIAEIVSETLDEKLQSVHERLDKMEARLDILDIAGKRAAKKAEELQLDIKIAEREIRREVFNLTDELDTVVEILKINDILPTH